MQKNKILAIYPDLCDHGYISDAFMDSANEVVCVTSIIGAIKCLVEYTFIMVLVDSKMVANGNSSITTTLKTVTDVPILIRTGHCNLMTKERWQRWSCSVVRRKHYIPSERKMPFLRHSTTKAWVTCAI